MPSGLDHSQGKWFAPGEALPPGFVVTTHPEGHTAPQGHHAMSDMARDSFVITTGTGAGEVKAASSLKKSKKSKILGKFAKLAAWEELSNISDPSSLGFLVHPEYSPR